MFAPDDRGPSDKLRFLFEAVDKLDTEEQRVIRELLEGMVLRYQAKRWTRAG